VALFLLNKREGRYLTSYIMSPFYDKVETQSFATIISGVFEYWFVITNLGGVMLQIYINLLFLHTMSTSLKSLRKMIDNKGTRQQIKQKFLKVTKAYAKLQLLSSLYNETLGQHFLARFQFSLGWMCVASAFAFVKLLPLGDMLISVMSGTSIPVLLLMLYTLSKFCSNIHTECSELKRFLMSRRVPYCKEVKRELEAFRVVGVKIGSFYCVHRGTPLTLLGMCSNTTMTMLISVNFSF